MDVTWGGTSFAERRMARDEIDIEMDRDSMTSADHPTPAWRSRMEVTPPQRPADGMMNAGATLPIARRREVP
jgi:hypothetical protein